MIVVVDTGMANVGSVSNIIRYLGFDSIITSDISKISEAKKLILPGVGSFDAGINSLEKGGIRQILDKKVLEDETPILGICLGMQMMTLGSEEGEHKGLGWFDAYTYKFSSELQENSLRLRIPHMGWNSVHPRKKHQFFLNVNNNSKFYFVHSYYVKTKDEDDIMATTFYGKEFVSALNRNNIYGVQFHPEKSHNFGMHFIREFLNI